MNSLSRGTNKKKCARFANQSNVHLTKYYKGLPKNYFLEVVDNTKKNVGGEKHCILVRDGVNNKEFPCPTKYLDQ